MKENWCGKVTTEKRIHHTSSYLFQLAHLGSTCSTSTQVLWMLEGDSTFPTAVCSGAPLTAAEVMPLGRLFVELLLSSYC